MRRMHTDEEIKKIAGNGGGGGSKAEFDPFEEAKVIATRNHYQLCNQTLPISDEKPVDLILFAGQSNSAGRAEKQDATTPLDVFVKVAPNVGFDVGNGSHNRKDPIVEPIQINGTYGYGYIPAFVNSYNKTTGRQVCACYTSQGGTMLNQFMPYTLDDNDGHRLEVPGPLFPKMVDAIKNSRAQSVVTNQIKHTYLVWCQGESDGDFYGTNTRTNYEEKRLKTFRQKVDYYKKSFTDMFNALKEQAGLEKVFIIRIGNRNQTEDKGATKYKYLPIIQAQNELGQENPDIVVVSTFFAGAQFFKENDGNIRNLMRDGYHYVPEGYVRAGLEAGVNAGIYVNTQFKVKPILTEYNQVYLDNIGPNPDAEAVYYEKPVDKYLYNPVKIDMDLMINLADGEKPIPNVLTITSVGKNEVGETITLTVKSDGVTINDAILSIESGADKASLVGNKLTLNKIGQVVVKATKTGYTDGRITINITEKPKPVGKVLLDLDFTNKSLEQYIADGTLVKVNNGDVLPVFESGVGIKADSTTNLPAGLKLSKAIPVPQSYQIEVEATMTGGIMTVSGKPIGSSDYTPATLLQYYETFGSVKSWTNENDTNKVIILGSTTMADKANHKYKIIINKNSTGLHEAYRDDQLTRSVTTPVTPNGSFEYILGAKNLYVGTHKLKPGTIIKNIKITSLD